MTAPTTSTEFDRVYQGGISPWGDLRIPPEVKALAKGREGQRSKELGCGLGRFSRWLSGQGLLATGVDFSAIAIAKARARGAGLSGLHYDVADVTALPDLGGPFAMAFDVGCFHCLPPEGQRAYAFSLSGQLCREAPVLIWALDQSPFNPALNPSTLAAALAPYFTLERATPSRRRLAASHWYHLSRNA